MNNAFKDSLSTRSKNGLSRCFGSQVLDTPEVIAEAGMARLRLAVGLGHKSLQEIALALYEFCYIDEVDKFDISKLKDDNYFSQL